MIIDGRQIADEMYADIAQQVRELGRQPHLTVFTCDPNFTTNSYLTLKKRKAEEVGIAMSIIELPRATTSEEACSAIEQAVPRTDGVVVQLPFPSTIDIDQVLAAIPASHDPDALNPDSEPKVLAPVAVACREILDRHGIRVFGKNVLVVGHGRLVGRPVAAWLRSVGGMVTVADEHADLASLAAQADIIMLGTGKPHILTPGMIHESVVILDAGTSEMGGEIAGDADPACAEIAAIFTPVPGGIGPVTIAALLRNLVTLAARR